MKYIKYLLQQGKRVKQRGDGLLISLFFSALVIVIAVSLSRFLVQDLFVFRDTLFSEKSYYLAESGVEKSLLALRKNPSNAMDASIVLGDGTMQIEARNNVTEDRFEVAPNTTRRLKLVRDTDPSSVVGLESVETFDFEATSSSGNLSWRIICQKKLPPTQQGSVSVSGNITSPESINNFAGNAKGNLDDIQLNGGKIESLPITPNQSFQDLLGKLTTNEEQQSCYMNLQNIGSNSVEVNVSNTVGMSPETVVVESAGEVGGKKKIISFEYQPINIGALFDFGLLHKE